MKNYKNKEYDHDGMRANIIRYWVQDSLDEISHGIPINLDKFEKKVLNIIKAKNEEEIDNLA